MTRLERFRAYMARMNPIADPARAIRDHLFVPSPGQCTAEMIVQAMEPNPTSTHLIVGGIGSGKSTEMLVATKKLQTSFADLGDYAEYVDVSREHDLGSPRMSGVLLALVGEGLVRKLPADGPSGDLVQATDALQRFARGGFPKWIEASETAELTDPKDPNETGTGGRVSLIPGVLVPPGRSDELLNRVVQSLQTVRAAYPGDGKSVVFLLDSLDRLENAARFRAAVEMDLNMLKRVGVGVVIVGPARFLAGADRAVLDLFDEVHFRLAVDPLAKEGAEFLTKVVRKRVDADMLPDESVETLVRASGGTLRDLIALGKRAGEEAYAAGRVRVEVEDAQAAADALGRSLTVGLDDEERSILTRLHSGKGLSSWGDIELSLIETRRILLYDAAEWRVHPALVPFLERRV